MCSSEVQEFSELPDVKTQETMTSLLYSFLQHPVTTFDLGPHIPFIFRTFEKQQYMSL
jgi:hypothetical protein